MTVLCVTGSWCWHCVWTRHVTSDTCYLGFPADSGDPAAAAPLQVCSTAAPRNLVCQPAFTAAPPRRDLASNYPNVR